MSAIETDDGWYGRMAARAAQRRAEAEPSERPLPNRSTWPVPEELRGYSARDVLLWYIADGWRKIFGEDEALEVVFDHDFGYHVMKKGPWQLTLVNVDQFPSEEFGRELDPAEGEVLGQP